ncbi:MAG: translation initiation factor [Gammaproteobacteria bacterium]|nr:translation initiation factor [Gammaproteobacteria bacterium]
MSWVNGVVEMLDQRLLPEQETYVRLQTSHEIAGAIHDMVVRGAPAIGIAAAYGVVLAVRQVINAGSADWQTAIEPLMQQLAEARPTAVNLHWAITRMRRRFTEVTDDPEAGLLAEARAIQAEDVEANRRMGELGAAVIGRVDAVLTHCNAGALATGGYGTALGVVRSLYAKQHLAMVYACETRPWLQGSRLTAWELSIDQIPVTLIADSVAATLMQAGKISWVIVGADRIAANGDVANKIGTYAHAVCARHPRHHGVRFMVVAPTSTFDPQTASGKQIPIEVRDGRELTHFRGRPIAPVAAHSHNPVFDVTPADLIDCIVTEKGVIQRPDQAKIQALLAR